MLNPAASEPSATGDAGRCLAFAGILQALSLVRDSAYGRALDTRAFESSLHSVFKLDAPSVEAIYGGARNVRSGLRLMLDQLGAGGATPDIELSRYLVMLLLLERKLRRRPDLLDALRIGVSDNQRQLEHFAIDHPNVLAGLDSLYSSTISGLSPRIMVKGDPILLADPKNAHKIRALLLAAMRSAVLWRQLGGSRLKLLFSRRRLIADARAWLARIDADPADT
jgi:high frequency lysogenization protein